MILKTKIRKTYNYIIRFAIILATYGFIYKQFVYGKKLEDFNRLFHKYMDNPEFIFLFVLVFVLMFVNWGIEAYKWKYLIAKTEQVSFIRSVKAVLAGRSVSIVTPNRIGDWFGRVFILKKASPIKAVLITIIGSMSQLLTTVMLGSTAMLVFIYRYINYEEYFASFFFYAIVVFVIVINLILFLLFINVFIISDFFNKHITSKWKRMRQYFLIFSVYSSSELLKVFGLSVSRYLIFNLQFFLLLRAFSVDIPLLEGLMFISTMYFILTAIPNVGALTELGIRITASSQIIGLYFQKYGTLTDEISIGIVSAPLVLWFINLALPALIGTFFVFDLKFFRKNTKSNA